MQNKIVPIGRPIEGSVVRTFFDPEKYYGSARIPTIGLILRFDDDTLPDSVNGREIYISIKVDPKSPVLRQFASLIHCRGILEFPEKDRVKHKSLGFLKMQERLLENIETVIGSWNEDKKSYEGGKIVGHRIRFLINRISVWVNKKSSRFPNNYEYVVRFSDGDDPIVFNIFEVSHFDHRVKGDEIDKSLLPDHPAEDLEEDLEEDDVSWDYPNPKTSVQSEEGAPF